MLGYDRRLFLVPLEQSGDAEVADAGRAGLLLDALGHAAEVAGTDIAELAVLAGGSVSPEVADEVASRGLTLVAPVDDRADERFAFAHGDAFAQHVEQLGPHLSSVRLRWHPDDDPEVKKSQALGLTKLAAWLHETDRQLLIELYVIPPGDTSDATSEAPAEDTSEAPSEDTSTDPSTADGDDLERVPETVREIRGLGIEADAWSVAEPADRAQAEAIAEVVVDEGRDRVAAIVRSASPERIESVAATCAGLPAYRGVAFGPQLWTPELVDVAHDPTHVADGAHDRTHDRDGIVRSLGDRFARAIELFTAPGPS